MAVKYKFNNESLSFEESGNSKKERVLRTIGFVAVGLLFFVIGAIVTSVVTPSSEAYQLRTELDAKDMEFQKLNDRLTKISTVLVDMQQRDDDIYRVIFETDPIPLATRKAGYGGSDRYEELKKFNNSQLVVATAKKLDMLSRQMYVQSKSFDELFTLAKKKTTMLAHTPAIIPIKNGSKRIVSGFGYRIHPIYKTKRMHTGIDIAMKRGTPVYATADGIIAEPKSGLSGYGITVLINHQYGYETLYAHLSKRTVKAGQKVKRGDLIGYVGSTGVSAGSHLHYEVWKKGEKVNPVHYFYNDLSPKEFEEVIEVASRFNQCLS